MATIIIDLDDNQIQAIMNAFGKLPNQRWIYELIADACAWRMVDFPPNPQFSTTQLITDDEILHGMCQVANYTPRMAPRHVAAMTGRSERAVRKHMKRLAGEGVIRKEDGRKLAYSVPYSLRVRFANMPNRNVTAYSP